MPDSYAPQLQIDLGAILANYNLLARRALPAVTAAVVKADAYGLGAAVIAPVLKRAGCTEFFVATVDEGLALRRVLLPGVKIYLLGGLPVGVERELAANDLIPVLNTMDEIARWRKFQHATDGAEKRQAVLNLDTGLNRLGIDRAGLLQLVADPHLLDGCGISLVISHLACADTAGHPKNGEQLARFKAVRALFPGLQASLANSGGIFLGSDYHFDLTRPGNIRRIIAGEAVGSIVSDEASAFKG